MPNAQCPISHLLMITSKSHLNILWVQVWVLAMVQGVITIACKCSWALLDHLCVYNFSNL
ncbi:hypothetical protein [Nostoc sp.]|uniref:hypothetical protein n=1 Tax=Nostoc sp. TaxID=1180 RepID=UPI002FF65BA1